MCPRIEGATPGPCELQRPHSCGQRRALGASEGNQTLGAPSPILQHKGYGSSRGPQPWGRKPRDYRAEFLESSHFSVSLWAAVFVSPPLLLFLLINPVFYSKALRPLKTSFRSSHLPSVKAGRLNVRCDGGEQTFTKGLRPRKGPLLQAPEAWSQGAFQRELAAPTASLVPQLLRENQDSSGQPRSVDHLVRPRLEVCSEDR